jgi:hypothetical protein
LKALLVDWNLNGTVDPIVVRVLLLGNAGKVLLVRLEGLTGNETLEDGCCRKVSIPKDTEERNDGKNTLNNDLSNRSNVPVV